MKNDLNKISPYFIKELDINKDTKYKRILIDASSLIVPERIDLIAKIKYIESKELNYKTNYFYKLYKKTIESFSKGLYTEPGNSYKNSFSKYIKEFDDLIIDMKENKFDPNKSLIPLGNNNAIIDGAHRLSVAYYFNQKVDCLKFEDISVNYNYEYFKKNLLEEEYLDYLTLEYCKLKQKIYIMLLKNFNDEKIDDDYKVIYIKNIPFNNTLIKNILFETQKLDLNDIDSLKLIVFETENINKYKEKIINEYNSDLIYISNIYENSIEILEMLLNKNSIEFLSNINIHHNTKINKQLKEIKEMMKMQNLNFEDYIFTSDVVMSLYDLKKCENIECLSHNKIKSNLTNNVAYNDKNYNKTLDELIYNPNNYFYYNSLKFLTLKNVKKNNTKDRILVNLVLIKSINLNKMFKIIKEKLKIKIRNVKIRLKEILKNVLKKIGLLEIIKKKIKKINVNN